MAALIQLTHPDINGNSPVRVYCDTVVIGGKKNLIDEPYANGTSQVEIQTQTFENLTYNFSNVHMVNTSHMAITSSSLTYGQLLALYRAKYSGSNPILLNITTTTSIAGVDGSTTNIKTVLKDFTMPLSAIESKNAYMPVFSFSLVETL
jgi:hypothetical protein